MKRLFAVVLCLCLLAGCGQASTGDICRAEEGSGDGASVKTETPGQNAGAGGETFRVIRAEDGGAPLLLAKADGGPGDVYTLSLKDTELTLDGAAFDRNEPGAYQNLPGKNLTGALVEVAYDLVLETYPGQLAEVKAVNIRSDGFDDRCALYLRVLNDLWAVDEGLNSDVTAVSVDLSQTSLPESEQAAVAWAFGGEHGISQVLSLNYEQLAAEGYLTGADPDSVKLVDVGFDLMSSMTTGNVDATIGCLVNHEVPQLEKEGFEVNYFFPDDFGVPKYYEGIFLASDEMIDNEPDVLAGFLTACSKGFEDFKNNTDEVLQVLLDNQDEANFALDPDVEKKSCETLLPLMETADAKFLSQTEACWQENIDWMYDEGLISAKPEVSDVMTTIAY